MDERVEAWFQAVKSLDERVNGEAEARAYHSAEQWDAITRLQSDVGELADFAIDTVGQIHGIQRRIDELTHRTILGLRLVLEAVDQLESRPTLWQRLTGLGRSRP